MANAKLIIKPPHMLVRMKPGYWPDLPKMAQTIRDAGYKPIPDRVELLVTGKVVKQGDGLVLELDRMQSPTALSIVAAKEDPDTAAHLGRHVGETVELEGFWEPASDAKTPGALAVSAIYGAEDKRPRK